MNLGKRLFDLQQIDLRLQKSAEAISRIEYQLQHNERVEKARADLVAVQMEQVALQERQRAVETEVDDLQARLKPIQHKLLKPSSSSPRELAALEKQAGILKAQVTEKEDSILEMMAQSEALHQSAADKAGGLQRLEREWARDRDRLEAERAALMNAAEADEKLKQDVLSQIDAPHLDLYQKLRLKKQGLAVARIEQGRCQGCKITIPVSELSQARAGDLVQCSSCSRVLCVP